MMWSGNGGRNYVKINKQNKKQPPEEERIRIRLLSQWKINTQMQRYYWRSNNIKC
jgi:hypothetical protein